MNIEIVRAENGYFIKRWTPAGESITGEAETDGIVFENLEEDEGGEVEAFVRLCWFLDEEIGPTTTKYSAKRVAIGVEAGEDYER